VTAQIVDLARQIVLDGAVNRAREKLSRRRSPLFSVENRSETV
jgi:hypothetical protein